MSTPGLNVVFYGAAYHFPDFHWPSMSASSRPRSGDDLPPPSQSPGSLLAHTASDRCDTQSRTHVMPIPMCLGHCRSLSCKSVLVSAVTEGLPWCAAVGSGECWLCGSQGKRTKQYPKPLNASQQVATAAAYDVRYAAAEYDPAPKHTAALAARGSEARALFFKGLAGQAHYNCQRDYNNSGVLGR